MVNLAEVFRPTSAVAVMARSRHESPSLDEQRCLTQMRGSLIEPGEVAAEAYIEPVIYYPTESMPSIVEAHLRADRNLKPDMAKALAELFRVAYTQFATKQSETAETNE